MPLAPSETWEVYVSFIDNNKKVSGTSFNLAASLAYEDAAVRAASIVASFAAVSNAAIRAYTITSRFMESDALAPPPESEVERKLRIPYHAGGFQNIGYVEIPSPVFSLEQADTDVVSPGNAVLAPLVTNLVTGGIGPGNGITDYRGADITGVGTVTVMHRNRKAKR